MTKKESPAPLATEQPAMAKPAAAQEAPAAPGQHPIPPQGAQPEPAAAGGSASAAPAQAPAAVGRRFTSSTRDVRDYLEMNKTALSQAMPKHVRPDRLLRMFINVVAGSQLIQQATPSSLYRAILQSAMLGLEPNTPMGEAVILPYYNSKLIVPGKPERGGYEAQFQPMYKGLLRLVRNSGELATIAARLVREKDVFEFEYGLNPICIHKPVLKGEAGEVVGAYCAYKLKSGEQDFQYMPVEEVMAIARRSKTWKPDKNTWWGPWATDQGEMQKKTVLKRTTKILPQSAEAAYAHALDNVEYGAAQPDHSIILEAGVQLPPGAEEQPEIAEPKEIGGVNAG